MSQSTCSVDDCGKTGYARGWCRTHYDRWRTHGDPRKILRAVAQPASKVLAAGEKVCTRCNILRPLDDFGVERSRKDGRQRHCRACRRDGTRELYGADAAFRDKRAEYFRKYRQKYRENERDRQRAAKLWLTYGMTLDQFTELNEAQGGGCAICGGGPHGGHRTARKKWLSVDHCHETGRIRGLLCDNCNIGIGKFKDDPALLLAAIEYLARTVA